MSRFFQISPGFDFIRVDAGFFKLCFVIVDNACVYRKRQCVYGTVIACAGIHILLIESVLHIVRKISVQRFRLAFLRTEFHFFHAVRHDVTGLSRRDLCDVFGEDITPGNINIGNMVFAL